MKMEEIKAAFKKDFPDEMGDCNSYLSMAMAAEEMGHEELAKGLYEMAHDEFTHAHFIHENLVNWGVEIPEAEMSKWHELEQRVMHIFHEE